MDTYFPDPERVTDKPFLMPIEDVFSISGRGTVVTGRVERGIVKLNETVEIVGIKPTKKTVVTGIEMFNKLLDEGQAGDNVGTLLRGIDKKEVERGQVLAKPGSITPHTKFKGQIYVPVNQARGRTPQPLLLRLSAPVLLPHDRHHRHRHPPRGQGNGHARRQHRDHRRADLPDRHGEGPQVRHPRGRPHGRFRPGHRGHRVIFPRRRRSRVCPTAPLVFRPCPPCEVVGVILWPSTVGRDPDQPAGLRVARLDAADDAELAAGHAGEQQAAWRSAARPMAE